MGHTYKYVNHRPFVGMIKTLTGKRTKVGEFYIYLSVIREWPDIPSRTGNAVGLDFGMKHFLTLDNGKTIDSPQWYASALKDLRNAHRAVSRCQKGSNNRRRTLQHLERIHTQVRNRRRDWFFKLANDLVRLYTVICIEDLNMDGMKHLWGRKVSDLAYGEFIQILEWVAHKNCSIVVKVDRWLPSSKACHFCGTVNTNLTLTDRRWICEDCGGTLDRDTNAAINIREAGISLLTA